MLIRTFGRGSESFIDRQREVEVGLLLMLLRSIKEEKYGSMDGYWAALDLQRTIRKEWRSFSFIYIELEDVITGILFS